MYGWIPLLLTWNCHNIVNWLYSKGPSSQGYGFSSGHVWMWELDGLWRKLRAEELMLLNCGVGEDSWESLRLQGDQFWVFTGRTDTEAETPILWPPHVKSWLIGKEPDAWRGLGTGEEGDNSGWDGRMASPTQRMWVWVNSGSWWWTGRPGVLQFMGLQRVGHDWATELNWYFTLGFILCVALSYGFWQMHKIIYPPL